MSILEFYNGKKVFITGHTGFKGSWLCKILLLAGADVTGYALKPETTTNIFDISKVEKKIHHFIGDVRDITSLQNAIDEVKPEIVIHLAAQPLVRESYKKTVFTYETNVMGTVNILECIKNQESVKSFLNVTTDKVYENKEWEWGYRENEKLDGYDPYSNSKACSELVTHCCKKSFFYDRKIGISTARAGNVIGGGDYSKDRIIPDCVRAAQKKESIAVRNPYSTRPYQHVLEPLFAYLLISKKQYENTKLSDSYNVGPKDEDCIETGKLVDIFCKCWGDEQKWNYNEEDSYHEANYLKLDCSKIRKQMLWKPTWSVQKAIEKTVEFEKSENKAICMEKQIIEFFKDNNELVIK